MTVGEANIARSPRPFAGTPLPANMQAELTERSYLSQRRLSSPILGLPGTSLMRLEVSLCPLGFETAVSLRPSDLLQALLDTALRWSPDRSVLHGRPASWR